MLHLLKKSWIGILFLSLVLSQATFAQQTSKDGFLKEVKKAILLGDGAKLVSLYWLEGSPKEFVQELKTGSDQRLKAMGKIRSVKLMRQRTAQPPHSRDGYLWGPNLKVLGNVVVRSNSGAKTEMAYGVQDRVYYLAGPKKIGKAVTDGQVQVQYNGNGRKLTLRLNGKRIGSGASGVTTIASRVQKGENKLVVSWLPDPKSELGPDFMKQFAGEVKVQHYSPQGQVRFEKVLQLEKEKGRATLEFEL